MPIAWGSMFQYICAWLQALFAYVKVWLQATMEDDPHDSDPLEAALAMEEDQVTVSLGPMGSLFRQQLPCVIASLQASRRLRLKAEIQILGQGLERLCTDLKDLSEAREDTITRCWVSQVRDLLYDTADYLDEVIQYSSDTHPRTKTRLLWGNRHGSKKFWVSRRLTWLSLPKVKKLKQVPLISKLSALVARVEDAEERRERFNLSPPQASKRGDAQDADVIHLMAQLPLQHHVDKLVKLLALNDDDDDNKMENKLKVVTIFGSAGVDKTAVARSLYHRYGGRFQHRAFLRVSRDPDTRRLLADLLSQIKAPKAHAFSDVKRLTATITKHLQGKSYLIIIDDLWNASTWDIISRALPDGDNCRIITATQIEDVALACCSYQLNHIYEITPLNGLQSGKSEGDCTAYPSSEGMKETLNIMYNNLAPHLKTCLLYLNMYLEGYTIRKDELVNQWVAEGFIGSVQGQDIENTAGCYFDALVSSGLVQSVDTNHNGEVLSCTLHHMVLDLIRQKSMEENFVTIVNYFQTILGLPDKVRRLSVQLGGAKGANNVPENMRISQVRSLLFSGFFRRAPSTVHYGLLQVLILHIWSDKDDIFDLATIGELYRLRYLKIECNITVKLPKNIRRLRHLGTLQVDARLCAVPSGIVHLEKLLHLRLPSESILPHGVGRMTCLRTLGSFDLGRNSEDNVRDLGELKNLQDLQLTCSTVQPAESLENNMQLLGSVLKKLSILRSLTLVPATDSCNVNTLQHDAGVSNMCIPCDGFSSVSTAPVHLRTLELSRHCCIFSRLPKWLGDLAKLRILKISVGELLKEDIDILKGVPALTALSLHLPTMSAERIVFGKGGFSVLTYFKITCTVLWLKLEANAMPKLEKLKLCFNAPIVDEQGTTPIIIEQLSSGITEISAKIGCAGVDARSALLKAITNDPRNPEVQLMASIYYDDQGRGMVTGEGSVEDENNETHSRAHAPLPSPSSSPLPAFSPRLLQPEVERMFTRGGSGRWSLSSASGANRSTSLREIDEAAILNDEDDDGGGKLYVAVGKDLKDGRSNLLWAARNLLAGDPKLVLLHVHQPADRIMIGLLGKVRASQVEEKELKAYRKIEKEEMNTLLNQYLNFCRVSLKVQAEMLVIEKNSSANGIIELIDRNHITKLVMGTSSFSMKRKVPKSKVAAGVHLQAKPYCQIFYICKETLACSREATQLSAKVESHQSSCASTISDQPEFPPRSLSLPPRHAGLLGFTDQQHLPRRSNSVSYPLSIADSVQNMSPARRQSIDSILGSTDQQPLPQRSNSVSYPLSALIADSVENMSAARRQSIDMTPTGSSPISSQQSTGRSSLGLKDLDSMVGSPVPVSVASSEEHQHSMVEIHEMFEQLHRVRNQLERSKKEASEGRQKAERDLFESSMMFKARESSFRKEQKEVEERLTREKTDLEKEHLRVCNELQKANEQIAELESKLLQTNALMEELQQFQAELQREKDDAVKEAEEMCQTNSNSAFGSTSVVALTEFSYTEIKEATDNFDDSKKIGSGGCGTVYKGFLRHTTVAIKKFNCEGTTGDKEFNNEVETLCRMRHPNLVTLIGVCREAKALVFEFLSNGSLENCLQCEHQREPLPWRMRIRIAADICTGLIFLHSNKPKGIAHGDLKPDNVLLDTSFVCKLADFGISRPLDLTNTTVTPYHRTNQIIGTMGYMDPEYIASGEITAQSDVYSFGVVLMRLLTGRSPLGLPNEVETALSNYMLEDIIDTSAGEWPPEYTEELARLALRCCRYERKERPDLAKEAWGILQSMMNCPDDKCRPPTFFICPMTQEIMRDPHIAADGFTYEGKAIKDWLQSGHKMSPMTYLSFTHHDLIPNTALRFAILEWQKQQRP